jgi:hypothetical protein
MPRAQVADGHHNFRVARSILTKQSPAAEKGWSYDLEIGPELRNPYHKKTSMLRKVSNVCGLGMTEGRYGVTVGTVFICHIVGISEHGNKLSDSVKAGTFLDQLSDSVS